MTHFHTRGETGGKGDLMEAKQQITQCVKTQDEKNPPCQLLFTAFSAESTLSTLRLHLLTQISHFWPRLVLLTQIGQYFFFIDKEQKWCPCSGIRQEVEFPQFQTHKNQLSRGCLGGDPRWAL